MGNELSTTNILTLFDTTEDQRFSFIKATIIDMSEGNIDPLKAHKCVKSMEAITKMLTDRNQKTNWYHDHANDYHELLLDAGQKYGKKFQVFNTSFEIKETGSSYDYSQCQDSVINELKDKLEEAKAAVKERETYLKTLPASGIEIIDKETGECYYLYPPSKSSQTTVTCSLK